MGMVLPSLTSLLLDDASENDILLKSIFVHKHFSSFRFIPHSAEGKSHKKKCAFYFIILYA